MAYEATSRRGQEPATTPDRSPAHGARVPGRRESAAAAWARMRASAALADSWRALVWSRLGIFAVALYAALAGGLSSVNAAKFDTPGLTHPFGGFGDLLLSPLARWDSVWYLSIANLGYGGAGSPRTAFFPLYPLLSGAVGQLGGGSEGAVLIASYLVALTALAVALYLLHRLTELELGRAAAGPAVLLLCVFPASLFLGAPYAESLFLAASIGAFYAARTEHWAAAGLAAAAASATRSAGVLLLVPLAILYWQGTEPGRRVRPHLAWLALAPGGLALYAVYLAVAHGDPLAFLSAQELWSRHFAGPFVGVWDGLVAAFEGVRQLASGSRQTVFFEQAGGDPFRVAAVNLMLFASLAFAAMATVGVLRRLPFAYGVYVVVALALPLSYPVTPQPLMSLPRFLVVLFPIFMWLGAACAERGNTVRVAAASALGLGLFTAQYASWYFIA